MGTIRLQGVNKQFGGQVVLANATLELHSNQIAALIGPNGAGKTTVFRLIAGQVPPDSGSVSASRGMEIGYLEQEPVLASHHTLREAVAEAFGELLGLEQKLHEAANLVAAEHDGPRVAALMEQYDRLHTRFEAAGGYTFETRLNEVLGGLGFAQRDYGLPVSALSGGQKCRAALAKLLLQGAARDASGASDQFLLLDEPTNHLDIDAVRWLERFLAGHHGGAVIVSHDRYLLDRLAERVVEVEPTGAGARLNSYGGNYSSYVQARDVRRLTQERQFAQDQEHIAKERNYIARYGAGQRARQAQGRLKRLERQIAAGEFVQQRPSDRRSAKLEFTDPDKAAGGGRHGFGGQRGTTAGTRAGAIIVRADGLRKQYDDKVLFNDLSLELYAGQRLGITGPNGTGKTTLLRILLGQVEADAGKLRLAPSARIGYFAQDAGGLTPENTIIEEIQSVRGDLLEGAARNVAASFLFTRQDAFKRVGTLSGGEQSRVRFLKLILTAPDVLILDEPTNHLDIPSRESLEESLADFPGTIIAVSHDRYFLDRIAQQLLVLRPEGWQLVAGNYTYYIQQLERQRAQEEARAAAERAQQADERRRREGARPQKRATSGAAKGTRADAGTKLSAEARRRFAKLSLAELEQYIHEHEQQVAALNARFGDAAVYREPARLAELQTELETLQRALFEAETEWLRRAEAM